MQWQAIFTLIVLFVMFILLMSEYYSADVIVLGGVCVLVLFRIISPKDATKGFSNGGMLTVASLFIVSAAIRSTGVLETFINRIMGKGGLRRPIGRMMIFVSFISAFMNNTPVVVMMTPAIIRWSERFQKSASKFLIPLSYATIVGGMCTLIGTSTNIIVSGLMADNGFKPIGMYELTKIGVPIIFISFIYILFVGVFILPNRKGLLETFGQNLREYLTEMYVAEDSPLIGQNIETAGLRHLAGAFLAEIDRGGKLIAPVSPTEILASGDRLVFTGVSCAAIELLHINGLTFTPNISFKSENKRRWSMRLLEVVVSPQSPLIGRNVRDANFRRRYDAIILAVHRNGEQLRLKIGDIKLQAGDTLILEASAGFMRVWSGEPDFLLISEVRRKYDGVLPHSGVSFIILLGFILLISFKPNQVLFISITAALAMIIFKCIDIREAYKSIDWKILIVIAGSIALGNAMSASGAADLIAHLVVRVNSKLGPIATLSLIFFVTSFLTEILSNNAIAVLMFPIALSTAGVMNVDPRPFFIAITIAASASFATPIGYQTNMIVYGAGGYKYSDFIKIGVPMNILVWIASTILIPRFWSF